MEKKMNAAHAGLALLKYRDPNLEATLKKFGKKALYLGVDPPFIRQVAKEFRQLPIDEAAGLIDSPWNEVKMLGLFILSDQLKRGSPGHRDAVATIIKKKKDSIDKLTQALEKLPENMRKPYLYQVE